MVVPPKSSILIGISIINHPFWGTPIFWKHPYSLSNHHETFQRISPYLQGEEIFTFGKSHMVSNKVVKFLDQLGTLGDGMDLGDSF